MRVDLAGFNVDKHQIDKLVSDPAKTPEVISAAYARISRSSKSVTELRSEARNEISKARSSNESIIYDMGHSSVAEHAVFNFDIIGVSRYLTEFIQRSRLASFTEKSQRYVTLSGDYVVPAEIIKSPLKATFEKLMNEAFALYSQLYNDLKLHKAQSGDWKTKRELEGAAKEDARYVLPLATKTQMGMTINARSLELLLRRLSSINLAEAHALRELLYNEVFPVAPSLIRYSAADEFLSHKVDIPYSMSTENISTNDITVIVSPENADSRVLAGLLFEQTGGTYVSLLKQIETMDYQEQEKIWIQVFAGIKPWHKLPRSFELVDFTFELTMSSSCYAQFKRHRLCTILKAPYNTSEGFVLPPEIFADKHIKLANNFLSESEIVSNELFKINPLLAPYALTNAHRVRVLIKMNLRELYHFVRLRSDTHAQWEIQDLSKNLAIIAKKHCPQAAKWLMGKSDMSY